MSNHATKMNVLSNITDSNITPYSENHNGVPNNNQLSSPLQPPMFDKNKHLAPGYTLLRGHIKLMAMVPHLPENQLSTKTWNQDSPYCVGRPSEPLPPITPRMMPSISQKYWPPQSFLQPNVLEEKMLSPNGHYSPPFLHHPSMWPQRTLQRHASSHKLPFQPPFIPASLEALYGPKPNFIQQPQQNIPASYLNSYPQQWHPSEMQMAYQMMNQQNYEKSQFLEYPYHNLHQSKGSLYYPSPQPQGSFPPTNGLFSYSPQQHQFPPYAVQSMPSLYDSGAGPSPHFNNFGMFPHTPQHCASLPILHSRGMKRSLIPKRSKKTTETDGKDVCIVIEEEEISSSSSLSSTEEYEIRRKPICVPKEDRTTGHVEVASNNPEKTSKEPAVDKEEIQKFVDNQSNNIAGKKGSSVVVHVHDCFLSDSSEAEIDQELSSDMDSARRTGKRKPGIMKSRRNGGGGIVEMFGDLENDLTPDEARTYNCEYLVELLSSKDWNNCCIALQIVVRMARHRPQPLLNYLTENGAILWCIFGHITSPKSALCRAAIVTFKELFEKLPGALDHHLEKITEKLVVKSLAPNKFIRVECEKALMAMVEHGNLAKILNALEHVRKKPLTRAVGLKMALARMALQIVKTAGVDLCLMNASYADKLLPMLFCFMMEPNSGIRTIAKEALGMLMNHLQFETAVMRHVTFDRNSTEVFKKLDKMRGRCNNYSLCHGHSHNHHQTRSFTGSTKLLLQHKGG